MVRKRYQLDNKRIGFFIKQRRLAREMSQEQLANLAGLKNRITISRLENGVNAPNLEVSNALCQILDINPGELLSKCRKRI